MRWAPVLLWCIMLSCSNTPKKEPGLKPDLQRVKTSEGEADAAVASPGNSFLSLDSAHVGRPGKNMLRFIRTNGQQGDSVKLEFYGEHAGEWVLRNNFTLPVGVPDACPQFTDIDSDGFKDVLFHSVAQGRLAVILRTLLRYDPSSDQLILIENATDYPNLSRNNYLYGINAYDVRDQTTYFLKIKQKRLICFASVSTMDTVIVKEYEAKGEEHIIRKFPNNGRYFFKGFKSYKPLLEANGSDLEEPDECGNDASH